MRQVTQGAGSPVWPLYHLHFHGLSRECACPDLFGTGVIQFNTDQNFSRDTCALSDPADRSFVCTCSIKLVCYQSGDLLLPDLIYLPWCTMIVLAFWMPKLYSAQASAHLAVVSSYDGVFYIVSSAPQAMESSKLAGSPFSFLPTPVPPSTDCKIQLVANSSVPMGQCAISAMCMPPIGIHVRDCAQIHVPTAAVYILFASGHLVCLSHEITCI